MINETLHGAREWVSHRLGRSRKNMEVGVEAQRLLGDELLKASFAHMEAEYLERALRAPDRQDRVAYLTAINVVRGVRGNLESLVQTGHLAEREIEFLTQQSDLL
jgi:hypothetical protein